jgi:hypothetical protein
VTDEPFLGRALHSSRLNLFLNRIHDEFHIPAVCPSPSTIFEQEGSDIAGIIQTE